MRFGLGFDLHKFEDGLKLILAGVEIEYTKGLLGNSDADIAIHAVCDAILGALSKGDIGDYFPDDDTSKGLKSRDIAKKTMQIMLKENKKITNIDLTLIMDKPRLINYKPEIRQGLATIFSLDLTQVNVKIKSQEGVWNSQEFAIAMAVCGVK